MIELLLQYISSINPVLTDDECTGHAN